VFDLRRQRSAALSRFWIYFIRIFCEARNNKFTYSSQWRSKSVQGLHVPAKRRTIDRGHLSSPRGLLQCSG
jgi:hypothetical protein